MGVFPPSSRNVILFSLLLTALTVRAVFFVIVTLCHLLPHIYTFSRSFFYLAYRYVYQEASPQV